MNTYFVFLVVSTALSNAFGANILVVLPHISYSHFKATSKLATTLEIKGHNVTVVAPYQMGLKDNNITEIIIDGIKDPIKKFRHYFFENKNEPTSYWSKLQYAQGIGSKYASHVLKNENVTKLIKSGALFDLVLMEDVSADALTIFSHIFRCPLMILLSEPLSLFYENYFYDNIIWKKYNELRNAHHYVIKELYREWIILPEQNKIVREVVPEAPDIREALYNTSLVFIPSFSTLSNLIPKYSNVKEIGGFNIDRQTETSIKSLGSLTEDIIVISDDLEEKYLEPHYKENIFHDTLWRLNKSEELLGHEQVNLFIGNGDIYETASAICNGVPVLNILHNQWFETFLVDTLVEKKAAFALPVNKLETKYFESTITELLLNYSRYQKSVDVASRIIRTVQINPAMDRAIYWIEYVIKFHGAPHLRSIDLQSQLSRHLIEIIIVLVIIDVALFLLFYWIIKHLPHLIFKPRTIDTMVRKMFYKRNHFNSNISYIRLDNQAYQIK